MMMLEKCSVEKGDCDQFCNQAEYNYKYFLWHPTRGCFIYKENIDEEFDEFRNLTDSDEENDWFYENCTEPNPEPITTTTGAKSFTS